MEDKPQLADMAILLGSLDAKVDLLVKLVAGNGMPGLVQKVEGLEAHKNRELGGLAVMGTIGSVLWGGIEYWFHYRKH